MTSLCKRYLKETQHDNDAMSQQLLTDQAIKRYDFDFQDFELTYRLSWLEKNYESIRSAQATWPQPVPDPKQLYRNFYEMIHKVSYNIVCASCGII